MFNLEKVKKNRTTDEYLELEKNMLSISKEIDALINKNHEIEIKIKEYLDLKLPSNYYYESLIKETEKNKCIIKRLEKIKEDIQRNIHNLIFEKDYFDNYKFFYQPFDNKIYLIQLDNIGFFGLDFNKYERLKEWVENGKN